jgi:hypothetical protein
MNSLIIVFLSYWKEKEKKEKKKKKKVKLGLIESQDSRFILNEFQIINIIYK